jgi:hypothetical protein
MEEHLTTQQNEENCAEHFSSWSNSVISSGFVFFTWRVFAQAFFFWRRAEKPFKNMVHGLE